MRASLPTFVSVIGALAWPSPVSAQIDDQPLPVYGTGKNIRDWIHVRDHAEALDVIMRAGDEVHGEVYNVCAENALSVLEITAKILEALGKPPDLIRHVQDRQGHDRRYWLTSKKLRDQLGWQLQYTTFDTGVAETVKWYAANEAWWRKIKSGEFLDYYRRQYAEIAE